MDDKEEQRRKIEIDKSLDKLIDQFLDVKKQPYKSYDYSLGKSVTKYRMVETMSEKISKVMESRKDDDIYMIMDMFREGRTEIERSILPEKIAAVMRRTMRFVKVSSMYFACVEQELLDLIGDTYQGLCYKSVPEYDAVTKTHFETMRFITRSQGVISLLFMKNLYEAVSSPSVTRDIESCSFVFKPLIDSCSKTISEISEIELMVQSRVYRLYT